MQRWHIGTLAVVSALLVPAAMHAQVLTSGMIDGQVLSASGEPLRSVRVVATSPATGAVRETETDADGLFVLRFVPPGEYDVLLELLGYAPMRVVGVPVRSVMVPSVTVQLRRTEGPAMEIDEARFAAAGAGGGSSARSQWIRADRIHALPHSDRSLDELARLSSLADDQLGVEGLPGLLSALRYEGIEWRPLTSGSPLAPAPLIDVHAAEIVTNGIDVEWGGTAGGVLGAYTARGAPRTKLTVRGTWSGDALPAAGVEPDDGYTDIQAEASIAGSLSAGRGGFSVGLDARTIGVPHSPAWTGPAADALIAADLAGADQLAAYTRPTVQEGTRLRAIAALDVPVSERHSLGGRMLLSAASLDEAPGSIAGAPAADALDLLGTAWLASALSDRWWNHAQLGVTHGSLERDSLAIAPLLVVAPGLETARSPMPHTAEQTALTVQNSFGARLGAHDIKLGFGARFTRSTFEGLLDTDGTYRYGGLDDLLDGTGMLLRTEVVVNDAEWTGSVLTAFAQDRWRPAEGLELRVGARVEVESLPRDDVTLDGEWLSLSGTTNLQLEAPTPRFSPRADVAWTPDADARWRLELAAGVYHDRYDPAMLAVWQSDAGTARVRRGVGDVAWPDGTIGGPMGLRLTLLGQDFAPPRTSRVSAAIAHAFAFGTAVQLSGTIRRTHNLPRRTDLNLTDDPFAVDQYGRVLFGVPVKQGGLLVEEPGTSRRFAEYDEVAAVSADGESKYWGVTLAVDHAVAGSADLFARYTFSRTRDDWFGARRGAWRATLPAGLDGWVYETSDFDVPHRGVVGAVVHGPVGIRISGLYRVQSGLPFTPGFRAGIDANADGVAGNDPAFVDEALPGMSDLTGRWSCLAASAGEFAERNACRGDLVQTLDASAELRLFTTGRTSASLLVEAFDLLESERRLPDTALYLIDPEAPLNVAGGIVTVPLVVNPDFGEPRAWPLPGRMLRVGLSLNW